MTNIPSVTVCAAVYFDVSLANIIHSSNQAVAKVALELVEFLLQGHFEDKEIEFNRYQKLDDGNLEGNLRVQGRAPPEFLTLCRRQSTHQ